MAKGKRLPAVIQGEIDNADRILGFHDWLARRFEASEYEAPIKASMLHQQSLVIDLLKSQRATLESELKQQRR